MGGLSRVTTAERHTRCAGPSSASDAPGSLSFPASVRSLLIASLLFFSLFLRQAHASDIVIGMSAAFSGAIKDVTIEVYRGAMAYFEHVNQHGGVNGRKIMVKAYDDGYNPIPAIANTIRLIEKDDVFLLFSYIGTPTGTRVLPLLKKYSDKNVYLFFPYTGAQPHREPPYDGFVFNLRASYRQETEGLVDNLVRTGKKRIALFYQADAFGRSGWDGVSRALAKHHLTIAAEATHKRGATYGQRYRDQVEILKKGGPDAVIAIAPYAACAGFIRDARDAGLDAVIAGLSVVSPESLLKRLKEEEAKSGRAYASNIVVSQVIPSHDDVSLAAVRQYRELMDRYDPQPPAAITEPGYSPLRYSYMSFEGYLNAQVLVEILRRMGGNPDRSRIKTTVEAIKDLDIGIGSPISFGPGRHQGLSRVYYTALERGRLLQKSEWNGGAK